MCILTRFVKVGHPSVILVNRERYIVRDRYIAKNLDSNWNISYVVRIIFNNYYGLISVLTTRV
jgi:hypothetical protein